VRFYGKQEFQGDLDDIVRRASYATISEDDVKEIIINKT
jgi:hypothetical protein